MGLWEACFHNYYPTIRPITTKRYEGCWTAMSYELQDLYDHFYPAWMRGVQAMVTMSMLQEVASVVLNIIYFIHCFSGAKERIIVLVSAILNFVSAFFCTISTIMFGVQVNSDRQWLPQPDSNYLSWAYGFCILGAILCLFAGMCSITDYFRLRADSSRDMPNGRAATYEADYSMAPPPPKYRY